MPGSQIGKYTVFLGTWLHVFSSCGCVAVIMVKVREGELLPCSVT